MLLIATPALAWGQIDWIKILPGTWKVEQQEKFEHWDSLNENSLKGLSYTKQDGTPHITEYLSLRKPAKKWRYEATVIGQNEGRTITFEGNMEDSILRISNPTHDFPKMISYQYIHENKLSVVVSDRGSKSFSYNLERQISDTDVDTKKPQFDAELAKSLGADTYGMKSYFLVVLKTGTNASTDGDLRKESFAQHLRNIQGLVAEEKLVVAGPIAKNDKDYRGIFIFHNLSTPQELQDILKSDLAIQNQYLDYDIYTWYGSAALPVYLETAYKISKETP